MSTKKAEAALPGVPQTILVVESDVLIRFVVADYLRTCGYKVHEAAHGDEAVAVLASSEVAVDVVFSEVTMPGVLDGFGLARWIRAHRPEIKVILTSGVDKSAEIAGLLCEAGPLLTKPYDPQNVADRIRQLLGKAGRP